MCTQYWHFFYVFLGCGNSYHPECIAPKVDSCPICLDILKVAVSTLSAKANDSIFNPNGNVAQYQDDGGDDMDDDDNDDEMPPQGQIVDPPAIHSQMTDADIDNFVRELVNDINGWRNAP